MACRARELGQGIAGAVIAALRVSDTVSSAMLTGRNGRV
jgi:hypothetical protein